MLPTSGDEQATKTKMTDTKKLPCPVCGSNDSEIFFSLDRAPVLCHVRYESAAAAHAAPTGRIDLASCKQCGMVFNSGFVEEQITYEVAYDNALHHSAHFRNYATDLARDLCDRYGIVGQDVVEIGCGDGFFLNLLCEVGGNRGWGFDPTAYQRLDSDDSVNFIQGYFSSQSLTQPPRLICCRHVLEHLPSPAALLSEIKAAADANTVVFFEVPDGRFVFEHGGLWDVLYEHCSYYSPETLRQLFETAGFDVQRVESAYHDQFLQIEAVAAEPTANDSASSGTAPANVERLNQFGAEFGSTVESWRERLQQLSQRNASAALWGAGTKGVMFLNALGDTDALAGVVDINKSKQGTFIAGTTLPVVAPEALQQDPPDLVLLMNSAYHSEVAKQLQELGVAAELLPV